MKVIFLDIDGVLNSTKTCVANGGYPHQLTETDRFDWNAIKLLQQICDGADIKMVLSSAWRITFPYEEVGEAFELPIIDKTDNLGDKRGEEIQRWLDAHPEVENYAIIDDDADMLETQRPHFIQTNANEGMTWDDYSRLCALFNFSPFNGKPRDRNWRWT